MERHILKFIYEAKSRANVDSLITSEYNRVRQLSIKRKQELGLTAEEGRLQENVKKNRYKDILPYDQTRVPLCLFTNENESDYINASFIQGATANKSYIATQGPLSHTVVDFWRMIWQYDVRVIIMACKEVELGKKKCENYWAPISGTSVFGAFTVTNLEESGPDEEVIRRTFVVKYNQDSRFIYHFQYTTWPDHGIPQSSDGILHMLELAMKAQGKHKAPVLVHCSAGCGRTGVLCAVDYVHDLYQTKQIKEDFSLKDIILDIRDQRPSAVQTKEQYEFVFKTVVQMFEKTMCGTKPNYENLNEHRLSLYNDSEDLLKTVLRSSLSCGGVSAESLKLRAKPPQPSPRKMNDTYAVVNKSKQAPTTVTHHYDNAESGGLKGKPPSATPAPATSELYSIVKPKGRPGTRSPTPLTVPIYDTAGVGKQRAGDAPAAPAKDHGDYEPVPGKCGPPSRETQMKMPGTKAKMESVPSQDDDYEYVSCPLKDSNRTADSFCTPGGLGFNCRIKKPKGPRDPPAEWSRAER
ncbi:tyrosine-protein phosphatase non-receptor type 18 isoform X1 [Alosa sapidissima]|uniref:tyrosine-protein phosphatase non-receptor type 18 isoform X1 n=1 Tax=Alosa sapidissima TaxID=34773 RepID=UPI001C090E0C|nr:tyrosine-protein phosphatase non-receptor type 18 isoform X1 [Alosa sapidissima]